MMKARLLVLAALLTTAAMQLLLGPVAAQEGVSQTADGAWVQWARGDVRARLLLCCVPAAFSMQERSQPRSLDVAHVQASRISTFCS